VEQSEQHAVPTFRIMTYNILFGGVGREPLIRDVVSAIHPDVVVFTEVTSADSFEAIADVVGPHRAGVEGRCSREHPAIVSRWPIIQFDLFGPSWAPDKWVEATLKPFADRASTSLVFIWCHSRCGPSRPGALPRCAVC
jgi:hypothetical protein